MSDSPPAPVRSPAWRLPALLAVGLALVAGAFWMGLRSHEAELAARAPAPHPAAPPAAIASAPAAPAPAAAAPAPPPPSFDIVRISPDGDAVIAGRAAPGAEVTIKAGDKPIGTAMAGSNGEWVFVPTEKLPPGGQQLTLSARTPDGRETASDGSVVLVVPEPGASTQTPLAVATSNDAAPRVLQGPAAGKGATLHMDAADSDEHGRLRVAGTAPPGATVRVYVDNHAAGEATADAQGHWTLTPSAPIGAGSHSIRADQLAPHGRIAGRVEVPFNRAAAAPETLAAGHVAIEHGQSLWTIAQRVYGNGTRYTAIYEANRDQIRNPDLIYPGQVLAVPGRE